MTAGIYWAAPVKSFSELEAPPEGIQVAYSLDRVKSLDVDKRLFFFIYKDGVWGPQSR